MSETMLFVVVTVLCVVAAALFLYSARKRRKLAERHIQPEDVYYNRWGDLSDATLLDEMHEHAKICKKNAISFYHRSKQF